MLHLRAQLRFHFREHLKMHKNVKKKMHFAMQLMIHLTVQSRSAPEGTLAGALKDALTNLHKDPKEGAYWVARKDAVEVALVLHLCCKKKYQKKDAFDVAVDGSFDCAIKGAPLNIKFTFKSQISGSIDKERMRVRGRGKGEVWPKV